MISPMANENACNAKYLADLAKIRLSSEEIDLFNQSLEKIISYFQQISEVHTEGVDPCWSVLETMHSVYRKDESKEKLSQQTFLENAPDAIGGMIKIPPVMEEE